MPKKAKPDAPAPDEPMRDLLQALADVSAAANRLNVACQGLASVMQRCYAPAPAPMRIVTARRPR